MTMLFLEKQPDYVFQLDSLLRKSKINTINTLHTYNEYRMELDSPLNHLDDTHWNANITVLVSTEILETINLSFKNVYK